MLQGRAGGLTDPWASMFDEVDAGGWYLYRFDTDLRCALGCPPGAHPLYLGKSNEPLRRLLEHAKEQPWWPHVTGWSILPGMYASNGEVLAAERCAIRTELPLANDQHNRDNPHRLDFGRPVSRAPRARASRPVREPAPVRRSWTPRQRRAAVLAAVWLVLAVAGWVGSVHYVHASLAHGARDGAVGATAVFVAAWWRRRPRRRRPARRSRRRRR